MKKINLLVLILSFTLLVLTFMGHLVNMKPVNTLTYLKQTEVTVPLDYTGKADYAELEELAKARQHIEETINTYGVGVIYMPSISKSIAILEGMNEYNLLTGLVKRHPEEKLGKGLWVGFSHSLHTNHLLLDPIKDIQKGDFIYLTEGDKLFTYEITFQGVIHESETGYLDPEIAKDHPKITIYRCEGGVGTSYRRVLHGILKENNSEEEKEIVQQIVTLKTQENNHSELEKVLLNIYEFNLNHYMVYIVILNLFLILNIGFLFIRNIS